MIKQFFEQQFAEKKICLLGFGREGNSTYRAFKRYLPQSRVIIADKNPAVPDIFSAEYGQSEDVSFFCGDRYLEAFAEVDVIFKSPGISLRDLNASVLYPTVSLVSQTDVFLQLFKKQTIGITGTKGKSTTVSLLNHILTLAGRDVLLGGNIGIPPFELMDRIKPGSIIVYEMSSHQLEGVAISPGMAVLLNIFQEHLDHYNSYRDYQLAKMNIARWQEPDDVFIFNTQNPAIGEILKEVPCPGKQFLINGVSDQGRGIRYEGYDLLIEKVEEVHVIKDLVKERKLMGAHNLINIGAASVAAHLAGVGDDFIREAVASFQGLPNRLELVREWNGVRFYNDSISTIPEATIEAVNTFPAVKTLLLGGYDRGIDYKVLTTFLYQRQQLNKVFIGKAGMRMMKEYGLLTQTDGNCFHYDDFEEAVLKAIDLSTPGSICLLSPAAASYDMFKNFEERGEKFRQIIRSL
jgi:UDP-N-acetylmuramoyl-L-alanine---L-glutamate ligase